MPPLPPPLLPLRASLIIRPVFAALGALIAGILCASFVTITVPGLFALATLSILAGIAVGWHGNHRIVPATGAAFALLFAVACIGAAQAKRVMLPAPNDIARHIGEPSLWVRGAVISEVETRTGRQDDATIATFTIDVNAVNDYHAVATAGGKLRVTALFTPPFCVSFGDTVWVRGRIEAPLPATNPGAFDYAAYLKRRGVFATLIAKRPGDTRLPVAAAAESVNTPLLRRAASVLRSRLRAATAANLPPDDAALLDGLLLSARNRLPVATTEAFTRTGTVHILSFSGLHLAVLAACLLFLLRLTPLPRPAIHGAVIGLLWLFALASGGHPSAVRAAVMATVFLAAPLLGRSPDARHSLAVAAILLLVFDPLALEDAGFQLSFATVAIILWWSAPLQQLFLPWEPGMSFGAKTKRWLLATLLIGTLAQIGSAPLAAYHFNRVSVIAPVANVGITLIAEAALISGLAVVLVAPLLPAPLAAPLWGLIHLLLALLRHTAGAFAALPFASFSIVSPPVGLILLWYALLGGGALLVRALIPHKTLFAPAPVAAAAPSAAPDGLLTATES